MQGNIKFEMYEVSTAYIVTQFGEDYAAFALHHEGPNKYNFLEVPPALLNIKGKTITKVKYILGKTIIETNTNNDKEKPKKEGRRKNYREPTDTEGITRFDKNPYQPTQVSKNNRYKL